LSGILWVASYPKSGNTWFRVFVANLKSSSGARADINDLPIPAASSRLLFDEATGVESTDLTTEEAAWLRPAVYRKIAGDSTETLFFKIHDAWTLLPGGEPLIPPAATRGAIYLVRNPLDVAVSYAHHLSKDVDEVIEIMARRNLPRPEDRPLRQLRQELLTWSEHVLSWISEAPFPVHIVKYEDMHERPLETFGAAAHFCGLPCDLDRITRAIELSSFPKLQQQESDAGFRERAEGMGSFFREGRAGGWRSVLTPDQIHRLIDDHESVMERFGYLPSEKTNPFRSSSAE
jgi:aryl sulfotransferase